MLKQVIAIALFLNLLHGSPLLAGTEVQITKQTHLQQWNGNTEPDSIGTDVTRTLEWDMEFYFKNPDEAYIFNLMTPHPHSNPDDWSFEILSSPEEGYLIYLGEGKFELDVPDDYEGHVQVKYLACNMEEMDLCYTGRLSLPV
ncbi:MAG: hypothetical protein AAFO94_19465, partial [Bacteroidota bacterium]